MIQARVGIMFFLGRWVFDIKFKVSAFFCFLILIFLCKYGISSALAIRNSEKNIARNEFHQTKPYFGLIRRKKCITALTMINLRYFNDTWTEKNCYYRVSASFSRENSVNRKLLVLSNLGSPINNLVFVRFSYVLDVGMFV